MAKPTSSSARNLTVYESIIGKTVRETMLGLDRREWPDIPVYGIQQEFRDSCEIVRGFVGGRGCGKTFIGALDTAHRCKNRRHYLVVSKSYGEMRDASFRSFVEITQQIGCYVKENRSEFYVIIKTLDGGEAEVKFKSGHEPNRLRGPNVSGIWFDEASMISEEAYTIANKCLREGREMGWISMTFTPQGKSHWTYSTFFDKNGGSKKNTELFHARTADNPFLADEFIEFQYETTPEGSALARQELDGEFIDLDGRFFQKTWFRPVLAVPENAARVRYWDKAGTVDGGDYSCGVLLARGNDDRLWYVEDVVHGRWSSFTRNQIIRDTARRDAHKYNNSVTIWIEQEPGSGGKESAELSIRDLAEFNAYADPVRADKETRARHFAAQAEGGNVRVLDAKWTDAFLSELAGFPEGKHDDQVDAVCGAYNKLAKMTGMNYDAPLLCYPAMGPDEGDDSGGISGFSPATDYGRDSDDASDYDLDLGDDDDMDVFARRVANARQTRQSRPRPIFPASTASTAPAPATPSTIPADEWAEAMRGEPGVSPLPVDAPSPLPASVSRRTSGEGNGAGGDDDGAGGVSDSVEELLAFLRDRAR